MSSRLASRRSFFYRRNADRIRLRNLRARLAQPKTHLSEQSLALPNAQLDPVALAQMFGQDWSIPQARFKSEVARCFPQIRLKRLHYPLDVILMCVRWYVAYPLSLRHLEKNDG